MTAHVIGPEGTGATIDQLYRQTVEPLTAAVGVEESPTLSGYTDIGLIRTRMGFGYNFRIGEVIVTMKPDMPMKENTPELPFKPGFVQRDLRIMKSIGTQLPLPPIPGASIEQLEEVLEGYTVRAKVDNHQIAYALEADTHTNVVLCTLDDRGALTRIEAFAGNVKGDADLAKLNNQLWIKLSEFKYDNCRPEVVVAFIEGPKLDYDAPDSRNIGGVQFCLPMEFDGKRRQLCIFDDR
jgi:hypothetical protein